MTAHAHKAFSSSRTAGSHQETAASRALLRLDPTGETIALSGVQHLTMQHVAGWTVRALSGTVWLTQDGDVRDVVLEPGQSFTFDRPGVALLSPLGEARIKVCRNAAAAEAVARRAGLRALPHSTVEAKATFA